MLSVNILSWTVDKKPIDLTVEDVQPYGKTIYLSFEFVTDNLKFNQKTLTYCGKDICSSIECFYLYYFRRLRDEGTSFKADGQGNFMVSNFTEYSLIDDKLCITDGSVSFEIPNGRHALDMIISELESYCKKLRARGY